jgi:ABC-type lipoprotein release transport system permease subunit
MVSSTEAGTGARVIGIYPEREKTTSNLYQSIIAGSFLEEGARNPVVIGEKLAEKLKVKLKSKIVITFQDSEGNITSNVFRVGGIYNIVNDGYEELNLFVRHQDILGMVQFPDGVAHEITVHVVNPRQTEDIQATISARFPGIQVLSWKELTPEFGFIIEVGDLYALIVVFVILLALGFGIVNTMLMAVLERIKELGMLMAVGMNKNRVFLMLMLETVLLTITGGFIGITGGIIYCYATRKNGIDLSIIVKGFEKIGRSPVVIPVFEIKMVLIIILLVIATGILASLYPARKAINFSPAKALRIDM